MRVYEELFIIKPGTPDEEIDAYTEQVKQVVASGGGTVDKLEKWGMRKLAYRVQKFHEGYYVLLHFTASADAVKEIERRMRVSDLVIKFLTVRVDQKLKKVEKRRKQREKRAQRKPAPAMAPAPGPSAPAPAQPVPGEPVPGPETPA